jgi:hypothetical protein
VEFLACRAPAATLEHGYDPTHVVARRPSHWNTRRSRAKALAGSPASWSLIGPPRRSSVTRRGRRCTAPHWLLALDMAVNRQFPHGAREHTLSRLSDHGCQPTSTAFMRACGTLGIQQAFTSYNNPKGYFAASLCAMSGWSRSMPVSSISPMPSSLD